MGIYKGPLSGRPGAQEDRHQARKRLGQQRDFDKNKFSVRRSWTPDGRLLTTLAMKGITLFRSILEEIEEEITTALMNGIICRPVNNTVLSGWGKPYDVDPNTGELLYPGTPDGTVTEKFLDNANVTELNGAPVEPLYPVHSNIWDRQDNPYFEFPSFQAGDPRIKGWGSKEWISAARRPATRVYQLPWYTPTQVERESGGKVVLSFGKGGTGGRYNNDLSEVYVYHNGMRLCGLKASDSESFVTGCWRPEYDDIVVARVRLSLTEKSVTFYKRPFKPNGYEDFWGNTVFNENNDGIAPEHWEYMGKFNTQCYQPVFFNASGTKACTMGDQDIPLYNLEDAPCGLLFDIYESSVVLRNYSKERGAWLDCELFSRMWWKQWSENDTGQDLAIDYIYVDDCTTYTCEWLWDDFKYWGNHFPDPCTEYYDTSEEACQVNIAYGHDGGGTCGIYRCMNVASRYTNFCHQKTGNRDDYHNYNEGKFKNVQDTKILVFLDYNEDELIEVYFDPSDLSYWGENNIALETYNEVHAVVVEEWKYIYRYGSGSNTACTPYETNEECYRTRTKYYFESTETILQIGTDFKLDANGLQHWLCQDSYYKRDYEQDEEDHTNIADWTTPDPDERCISYGCYGQTSPPIPADVPDTPTHTEEHEFIDWDYTHTQIGTADFRLKCFAYTDVTNDVEGIQEAAEWIKTPTGGIFGLGMSPTYVFGPTMHGWLFDVLQLHATAPDYEWYEDHSQGDVTEYVMQFPTWALWRGFFLGYRQKFGLARNRHGDWVMSVKGSDNVTAVSKASDGNPLEKLSIEDTDGAWLSELGVI